LTNGAGILVHLASGCGAEWVIAQACPLFVFDLITPLDRVRPLRFLTMTGRRRPNTDIR